jgi:uncharacterized protein with HEPN domain
MTQHDPLVSMRHIRDHALEAVELLESKSLDDLREDRVLQLALVQLIEIVGEAANRVPSTIRHENPDIPWRVAAETRNKLIHGYDVIEYSIVYDTVKNDLPPMVAKLGAIIEGSEPGA